MEEQAESQNLGKVEALPILPLGMKTQKPTWSNIRFYLNSVIVLSILFDEGAGTQHIVKGLGKRQLQVLKLLQVPVENYHAMTTTWWKGISIRGQ